MMDALSARVEPVKRRIERLNDTTLAFLFAGVFAFGALFTIDPAAAAIEVCGQGGTSGNFQSTARDLVNFIVFIGVGGGSLYAGWEQVKITIGDGSEKDRNKILKGVVATPVLLYGMEFALDTIFDISITCLMPWGG